MKNVVPHDSEKYNLYECPFTNLYAAIYPDESD